MAYKTGNPALNARTFASPTGIAIGDSSVMTLEGTVQKTFFLVMLVIGAGALSWAQSATPLVGMIMTWGGLFAGFITAMVLVFNKQMAPALAPLYAIFEGLALGGISAQYNSAYQGIVAQAMELTVAVLLAMLLAYTSKLIKPTENFKLGVFSATAGICLVYLLDLVLSMFGHPVGFIHDSGPLGIGISLFIVLIASLNLVLDFDFIEQGTLARAPKYMEWYGGFGLLVTLVWLYLEILRLLAKTRRR
jgi:uncharacterized YccA/Bax inhibitor family protein